MSCEIIAVTDSRSTRLAPHRKLPVGCFDLIEIPHVYRNRCGTEFAFNLAWRRFASSVCYEACALCIQLLAELGANTPGHAEDRVKGRVGLFHGLEPCGLEISLATLRVGALFSVLQAQGLEVTVTCPEHLRWLDRPIFWAPDPRGKRRSCHGNSLA